jgi:hypothetical protein
MPRSRDARRPVHVEADVAVATELSLAGVEAHPHTNPAAIRPALVGKTALRIDRRSHGVCGGSEDGEEGITLCAYLDAVVVGECPAGDDRVTFEQARVPVAQLLQQASRAFNVGEQERHRACRQVMRHDLIMRCDSAKVQGLRTRRLLFA